MITARRNLSSIPYDNKIYTFGGVQGRTALSNIEVYDINTGTWELVGDMPTVRYSHESVLYKDKVYILGGYNDIDGYLNRVDIYDFKTGTWSTGADMPIAKSGFVAEVVNGKIYCIAGEAHGGYSNTLEIYDIKSNSWTQGTSLSIARGDADGVHKNGNIYIIGGYDGNNVLDTVDVYNVNTGTWDTLSNTNIPRYSFSASVYREEIYIIGGYDASHSATSSVEKYNIDNDIWEPVANIGDAKGGATSQSYYGNVYLIGGHNNIEDVSSVHSYTIQSPDINDMAIDAVEKAEESCSDADIAIGRSLLMTVTDDDIRDSLKNKLDFLEQTFEKKSSSANVDIYIKSENMLLLSLNTNQITFENFSGVDDMLRDDAIEISINSSLQYNLNAYLMTEIQNADKSQAMNKEIFQLKEDSEIDYQYFNNIDEKMTLKSNCDAGNNKVHLVDFKLKGGIAHEKDVYKTVVKFEAEQI